MYDFFKNDTQTNEIAVTHSKMANNGGDGSEFQNVPLGIFYLLHSLFYYPFYIPCAIVMWRKPKIEMSCYKFMASLAVVDMCGLVGVGFFPAFWSILGLTYCDNYWQIKCVGAYIDFMWISYCYLCMSLSINRAVDITSPALTQRLFDGRRTYYWIAGSLFCGFIYFIAYLTPYASYQYHSGLGVLLFDNDNEMKLGIRMNTFTGCLTPTILTISYVIVFKKIRSTAGMTANPDMSVIRHKRRVAITSVIICVVAGTAALSYPITQAMDLTVTWPMTLSHIWWQLSNGSNCFVYLFLNKEIRKSVKILLKLSPKNTVTPVQQILNSKQRKPT